MTLIGGDAIMQRHARAQPNRTGLSRVPALVVLSMLIVAANFIESPAALAQGADSGPTLNIATWGGAYGQSQEIAYFAPFTRETRTKIKIETYNGTLAAIMGMIGNKNAPIDVVDMSAATLATLCRDGHLEAIDSTTLGAGPDGQTAADDFVAGGLSSCGVASVAWSTAIAFDRGAFEGGPPTKIADLLDTKRFPGKRALPNGPRYTLELALLADGVEPDKVYAELGTPAGTDRAFSVLDKIKAEVLWWNKAQDPLTWLARNKVVMAASYSGRIFRASIGDRQSVGVLWDGQIYDLDLWAIPKSAASKDLAKRFIAFASEPARLAVQAQLIAYGPMRKSAIPLVGKHPVIDVEVASFLPTAPQNFQKVLKFDEGWWIEHGAALGKRFKEWRAQVSMPAGSPEETSSTKQQQ